MSKSIYKTFSSYKSQILKDNRSQNLIFDIDGRNHYVYRISDLETRNHYYGSRVTKLNPEDDLGIKYFSSSSNKEFKSNQKEYPNQFKYKVIRTSDSHGDNIIFESYLHQYFQVSSNQWFLNKCNQTPFGWTVTGNKEISKKAAKTKSKVNSDTGTSIAQDAGKKQSDTITKVNPETCTSIAQDVAKKGAKTKSKVNSDTGTSIAQDAGKKRSDTMMKVNPKTNTSIAQDTAKKGVETKSKVNLETNTSIAQDSAKKAAVTMSKVNLETGTSIYQDSAKKISGKNNYQFSGYFIYNTNSYVTAGDLSEETGISANVVRLWCGKNNLKIFSNKSYSKSVFLQGLGSREDIVGKTPHDLGFSFQSL